jgi:arginyl-tRNA synthetase
MQNILEIAVKNGFREIYQIDIESIEFQSTRKEFEGDITIVVFAFLRTVKGNPVEIGTKIGEYLKENVSEVTDFNVVKGFLNLVISDAYFVTNFYNIYKTKNYGFVANNRLDKAVMVEYSSPNTNKPLHLGHIRNNLLGYAVAEIIKASGKRVYKTQIINDRGIHICKSMLAWLRYGNGETPESSGLKGDKLVGNYYIAFDKVYKEEISQLKSEGKTEEEAKKQAPILLEAQEMLIKWESGDADVVALWKKMNQWVYTGFDQTYKELGVDFNKNYYESNTYLLGKDIVLSGLEKGIFYKKEDGSVWIDLTEEGLDEKIVLRADGTAVYMTQDIGTAIERFKDYDLSELVYTVGNEQDYHFKVLFLILDKLGFDWAKNCYHLSYGMVDLPQGKMKSREGTVVDADDLMIEMTNTAREISQELGKLEGYSKEEKENLYKIIGLGALKYFILKVDPKRRILFNPEESVDFAGNTGPFIQYTYARIQSILRKADFNYADTLASSTNAKDLIINISLHPKERDLIKQLQQFPEIIQLGAKNHSPALIANYTYDLVKSYNSFYQSVPILGCENLQEKIFRTQLSAKVAEVIRSAFKLLGINVPERM